MKVKNYFINVELNLNYHIHVYMILIQILIQLCNDEDELFFKTSFNINQKFEYKFIGINTKYIVTSNEKNFQDHN